MTVFDPDDVHDLRRAFDLSWRALGFAFDDPNAPDSAQVRLFLANQIISMAKHGEMDPGRLSSAALGSLPPFPARWVHADFEDAEDAGVN